MKYKQLFSAVLFFSAVILLAVSCKKTPAPIPLGDDGQTIVKFLNGMPEDGEPAAFKLINLDLVATPQVLEMVELRRDLANNADLNTALTVTVKQDPGIASTYNSEFVPLPDGSFTVESPATLVGEDYTVTFAPGEISKTITISLTNALALDLSQQYALGFTIVSTTPTAKVAALESSFVIQLGVKNPYDGVYRLYGGFSRSDLPTYIGVSYSPAGYYEPYNLITVGSNSVLPTINTAAYGPTTNTQMIYVSGGNYTYFTGVAPKLNIDKATNAVTVTQGTAAVGTSVAFTQNPAELAASKYYPNGIPSAANTLGKKTIVAHFRWTSGTPAIDRITMDTFVYKFAR